jgi:hypothetical protein
MCLFLSCFLLNVRKKNLLNQNKKDKFFNKIIYDITVNKFFIILSVSSLSFFYHSRYKLAITSFVFIEEMFSFFNTRFECTKETMSRIWYMFLLSKFFIFFLK